MTLQFLVADMACGGCADTIAAAVKTLDPTAEFTADITTKLITIATPVARADMQTAIMQAGYHPEAVG
jgi:copper chaperone